MGTHFIYTFLDFPLQVGDVAPDLKDVPPTAVVQVLSRGRRGVEGGGRGVLELVHNSAIGTAPFMPAGAEVLVVLIVHSACAGTLDDGGAEHPRPRAVGVPLSHLMASVKN